MGATIPARYFEGLSEQFEDISLFCEVDKLSFQRDVEDRIVWPVGNFEVSPGLGKNDWTILGPNGAKIKVKENFSVHLRPYTKEGFNDSTYFLKKNAKFILGVVLFVIVLIYLIFGKLVPEIARQMAFMIPYETEQMISQGSLDGFKDMGFTESKLKASAKEHIQDLFLEIKQEVPELEVRLELMSSGDMGPNAFAIPGGVILMTDEIIEIAESDDELLAVMAHEMGHLVERHGLRTAIQNSLSSMVMVLFIGDSNSISSLASSIPNMLLELNYSREMEREADAFAFDLLKKKGLDTNSLSSLLQRIEDQYGNSGLPSFLSSHPQSEERVEK